MRSSNTAPDFEQRYQNHLQHLKLKGLRPKTIDAYARAIGRMGAYFDHQIDQLSPVQLTDYFTSLLGSHSCTIAYRIVNTSLSPWASSAPCLATTHLPFG